MWRDLAHSAVAAAEGEVGGEGQAVAERDRAIGLVEAKSVGEVVLS